MTVVDSRPRFTVLYMNEMNVLVFWSIGTGVSFIFIAVNLWREFHYGRAGFINSFFL